MKYISGVAKSDLSTEAQAFFISKKVVVTGGAGFIGSHVTEQLVSLGAKPIVITRGTNDQFVRHLGDKIEIRKCDLSNYHQVKESFSGAEIILNLAASVGGIEYNKNHPASIFQQNLETFFNSIRVAQEIKVQRFLVTSSACVYPRICSLPTPEEEGVVGEPEPTNSGYGWAKRMEEYLGKKYADEYKLSVAIARPYNAYGPRDNFEASKSHVIPALIQKAFAAENGVFEVWGSGDHSRSFLYVDDFARGLLEVAAKYPEADPVNLGAHEEITISNLANMIGEMVGEIKKQKVEPKFNSSGITGQPRRMCDTTKAEKVLGFKARVPFREGLLKTILWYRDSLKT